MRLLKQVTKDQLSVPLAVRVVLLVLVISGCGGVPVKKRNEVWKINSKELLLYRIISDTEEETIPIGDNPDMKKFMCISGDEFEEFIEEMVK